jgi:hypothetical protein
MGARKALTHTELILNHEEYDEGEWKL